MENMWATVCWLCGYRVCPPIKVKENVGPLSAREQSHCQLRHYGLSITLRLSSPACETMSSCHCQPTWATWTCQRKLLKLPVKKKRKNTNKLLSLGISLQLLKDYLCSALKVKSPNLQKSHTAHPAPSEPNPPPSRPTPRPTLSFHPLSDEGLAHCPSPLDQRSPAPLHCFLRAQELAVCSDHCSRKTHGTWEVPFFSVVV